MAYQFDCYDLTVLGVSGYFYLAITAESDNVCFADFILYELITFIFHFIFSSYNYFCLSFLKFFAVWIPLHFQYIVNSLHIYFHY